MRTGPTVLAVVVALTAITLAPAAPVAQAAPPTPRTGAEPAAEPGDLLSATPTAFRTEPMGATKTDAWRIEYRSTTARGRPNIVSGTVVLPRDGKPGPRPLVTWGVGAVGLADSCAPSTQFPHGTSAEAAVINLALRRGWAVVVTDYEGLGRPGTHTYTVGRAEGQAMLDAARAAQQLPGAGLSARSPVGIVGYSQGGQGAGWAAELHHSYAPELRVRGTVAGGVPADLLRTAAFDDAGGSAGLVLMAAIGQQAAFPELRLGRYLTAQGRDHAAYIKHACVPISTIAGLFGRLADVTVRDPLERPDWQRRLRASDLGTRAPDQPVYLYQGTADELIPYEVGSQLRDDWRARGASVRWMTYPLEHVPTALAGVPPALDWLSERLAG